MQVEKVIKYFNFKVQVYLFSLWERERRPQFPEQDPELHMHSVPSFEQNPGTALGSACPGKLLELTQMLPSKIWLIVQLYCF